MALLLVTEDREYLVRHPKPSADFTRAGYDSLLQSDVLTRPRVFAPALLSTFPAVGGIPTIVIGKASATSKSSTAWVLTLLHEHFHQLQMTQPGYYAGVNALGLARGDQSGMWMLNYAFPYDSTVAQARFAELTDVLRAFDPARADASMLAKIVDARDKLRSALAADDARYLDFQMWQEGVARYTELAIARRAAAQYSPSAAFAALPDFTPYGDAAASLEKAIRSGLESNPLQRQRRVAFYAAGAAFAEALATQREDWRPSYWSTPFRLTAGTAR
jgi:hypothetical protein